MREVKFRVFTFDELLPKVKASVLTRLADAVTRRSLTFTEFCCYSTLRHVGVVNASIHYTETACRISGTWRSSDVPGINPFAAEELRACFAAIREIADTSSTAAILISYQDGVSEYSLLGGSLPLFPQMRLSLVMGQLEDYFMRKLNERLSQLRDPQCLLAKARAMEFHADGREYLHEGGAK